MVLEKERYRMLVENLPEAYACFQAVSNGERQPADWMILEANPAFEALCGMKREEFVGRKVSELISGAPSGDFDWSIAGNLAPPGDETLRFEQYSKTLDRWFEIAACADLPGCVVAVFRDITETRKKEELLRRSEEKYRMLVENLSEVIYTLDENAVITYISPNIESIGGYTSSEMLGRCFTDFVYPGDLEGRIEQFRKVLSGVNEASEYRVVTKSGRIAWVRTAAQPVVSEGRVTGINGVLMDITDRKRAEQVLQDAYRRLDEIIEFLPDATFVIDREGVVLAWNKTMEVMTGIPQEKMIGRGDHEYALPFYGKRRPLLIDFVLLPGTSFEMLKGELKNDYEQIGWRGNTLYSETFAPETYNGKGAYLWIAASRLHDAEGNVVGAIETIRDITDRKCYEEQLKYLSMHDQLTGLYNRAFFEEEMQRLSESREHPISIISADLDELKYINDTMGHARGDELIKACAEVLGRSLRSSDILARVGGDEFAVLLPQTDEAAGEEVARRIRSNAALHNERHPAQLLSISVGVATAASREVLLKETFKKADDLMFREKLFRRGSAGRQLVDTFVTALNEKDYLAEGHAERLSALCLAMGEKMGLPSFQLANLTLLAQLHDLGKVAIPDQILFKEAPLAEEEWEVISRHSQEGYNIAASFPEFADVADLILKHHEWWNGAGYPLGLKGEEIPLECRIFAIADAYDAMISDRPYRETKSREEALQELRCCAGTQFDPELVELFLTVLDEKDEGSF